MAKPRSILVVDDDEALAHILSELLHAHGYSVWTAHNGVQGYGSYFCHPTDIVVTDIEMPEMDGFAMMRCIRAINPAVKTIYLSGAVEYFRNGLESEGREFPVASLLKPFSTKALLDLMSEHNDAAQA
jgi:CheY-like chemotaxis protein